MVAEGTLVLPPFSRRLHVGYETLRCSFAHPQGSPDKGFEQKPQPTLVASFSESGMAWATFENKNEGKKGEMTGGCLEERDIPRCVLPELLH